MPDDNRRPALHPVVDALELLTLQWNPPHRSPRAIARRSELVFQLPAKCAGLPTAGSYLRGLDLSEALACDLSLCDLRGCVWVPTAPPVLAGCCSLRDRLRPDQKNDWPRLQASRRAGWAGHSGPITTMAFSPDSRYLASAGGDGRICVWALQTDGSARELTRFIAHKGAATDVAFSPDGHQLASAGEDGHVCLWAFRSDGSVLQAATLTAHEGAVNALAFGPDGREMASVGADAIVRLWSLEPDGSAREAASLSGHEGTVWTVAFSADGRYLASGGVGRMRLWELKAGSDPIERARLAGHDDIVRSIAFSPDSKQMASAADDELVCLWSLASDGSVQKTATITWDGSRILNGAKFGGRRIAFSPDGRYLATAGGAQPLRLWLLQADGSVHEKARLSDSSTSFIAFRPDGKQLVTHEHQARLCVLQTDGSVRAITVLAGSRRGRVRAIAFHANGKYFASTGSRKGAQIWTLQADGSACEAEAPNDFIMGPPEDVAYSADGNLVVMSGFAETTLCDLRSQESRVLCNYDLVMNRMFALAFSSDSRRLAVGNIEGHVQVWTLNNGIDVHETANVACHKGAVRCLAFSHDSQYLASAGDDHAVNLFSLQDDGSVQSAASVICEAGALSVAFGSGAKRLASVSRDGIVHFWAIESDGSLRQLQSHTCRKTDLRCATFSADLTRVAVAGSDHEVHIHLLEGRDSTGEEAVLSLHEGVILSLAFSPDGETFVSGDDNGAIYVWKRLTEQSNDWRATWATTGAGLSLLDPGDPTSWHLMRSDGTPWETESVDGHVQPADETLYNWLWFMDPDWGAVPAFDVPPRWLEWSEDFRVLTVRRAPHTPKELQDWLNGHN